MAVVPYRRRFGFGSAVTDYVASLPFAYAAAFPHVDFASLSPDTTIGDLLHSGAISESEYESVFGPPPTLASTADDYNNYVASIKAGMASGTYTSDSLNGVTPQWYLDNRTILATGATARAGGFQFSSTGAIQSTDVQGNVTGTIGQAATTPTAPTGPKEYLQGGIDFFDNGSVKSVNGTTVTGKTLTADQMQRLLSGQSLTAAELAQLLPPQPAPAASGQSGAATPSTAQSQAFASANDGSQSNTVLPPTSSTPTIVPPPSSSGIPTVAILAGAGLLAFLFLSRRKKR